MKWKRWLAATLVLIMTMTLLPAAVWAEEKDNDGVPLPSFSKKMLDEEGAIKRALDQIDNYEALDRLSLIADAVATEKVVNIKAGASADAINKVLQSAVKYSEQNRRLVVCFEKDIYKINKCLNVYSNTVIKAGNATFIRTNPSLNLLRNVDSNGRTRDKGKYDVSKDIVIQGGIWDGGDVKNTSSKTNTMNFGHVKNLLLRDAIFKNNYGAHLVELSGVYNAQIVNCKFSGHIASGVSAKEAIQLDVAGYDSDGPWTSTYKADWTVCDKILIQDCTVSNYPRAVGNHHYKKGYYNKNITVTGNNFYNLSAKNKDGYPVSHYAVYLFGFDNVKVSNNKISGCDTGVALHHASGIKIKNNQISNTSGNGISIYSQSKVEEISGNSISKAGKYGISINGASLADSIHNNQISSTTREGICISEGGTSIGNISDNTVSKAGLGGSYNGIMVNFSAKAGTIKGNTVKSVSKHGISIYQAKASSITGNAFNACSSSAISYSGSKYAMSYRMSINGLTSSSTTLSGTTGAGASVWVTIGKKKYTDKADGSGKFSIKIPKQRKGTTLTVNAKISNDNRVYATKKVS